MKGKNLSCRKGLELRNQVATGKSQRKVRIRKEADTLHSKHTGAEAARAHVGGNITGTQKGRSEGQAQNRDLGPSP